MSSSWSRRRIAGAAALVLLPGLLLAGCSAASSTPGSVSGAQASAKAVASAIASAQGKTAPAKASGPVNTGDELCGLVSVGDAQGAVKADPAISETVSGSFIDDEPMCTWAGGSGKVALNAILYPLKDNPFDGKKPVMSADPMTSVAGLGGTAGINKDELDVIKGDTVLSIETTGRSDLSNDQMVALAKLILARI